MRTTKVPLVHYEDGKRIVIGEAVVEMEGDYVSMEGKITDPAYHGLFMTGASAQFSMNQFDRRAPHQKRRKKHGR